MKNSLNKKNSLDKQLIRVIYSTWEGGNGCDVYYVVDRETGKQTRMTDQTARELIAEGNADVIADYAWIPQIKFVLTDDPGNQAYKIDGKGKETKITLEEAHKLIANGRATIKDIELPVKTDSINAAQVSACNEQVSKSCEPKIYTSRFQNPELISGKYTVVGIVRYLPRFPLKYERAGNIIDIAPTKELFNENDRAKFTPPYKKHLDEVGFERISEQLKKYLALGKDVVLCCYCDLKKTWCHRLVFAEWWLEKTGVRIEELPIQSKLKFL